MKRILLNILTLCLCAAAFASCGTKCDHDWERTANYDTHTAVDKCSICEETRMYTERDSMSTAPNDEVQWPVVPTIFPLAPPHLFVSDGKNAVEAWRGTSSWFTEDESGMGTGVNSDSMHPLECKDTLPSLEITKKSTVTFNFEAAPSKITVKRYKLNATDYDDYDEITASLDSFEAKAGDYVYEIIASWSGENYSGTVYYAFRTEK